MLPLRKECSWTALCTESISWKLTERATDSNRASIEATDHRGLLPLAPLTLDLTDLAQEGLTRSGIDDSENGKLSPKHQPPPFTLHFSSSCYRSSLTDKAQGGAQSLRPAGTFSGSPAKNGSRMRPPQELTTLSKPAVAVSWLSARIAAASPAWPDHNPDALSASPSHSHFLRENHFPTPLTARMFAKHLP
jgi:hypothetical protein